jgi:KAP family P-loop domain
MWERLMQLGRDLLWVLPGALVFLVGWEFQAETVFHVLKWLLTAAGGIAAAIALLSSIRNALMRHLLAESPRGTKVLLRTTDPMEDLLRRYAFLIRSTKTGMIVLIDNLDRCHAEYVVEMLEGIQTLLRTCPSQTARRRERRRDILGSWRSWWPLTAGGSATAFCTFMRTRPRALMSQDVRSAWPFSTRSSSSHSASPPFLPRCRWQQVRRRETTLNPFQECTTESAIRRELRKWEERLGASRARGTNVTPVPALRKHAVEQLAEIELKSDPRRQSSAPHGGSISCSPCLTLGRRCSGRSRLPTASSAPPSSSPVTPSTPTSTRSLDLACGRFSSSSGRCLPTS